MLPYVWRPTNGRGLWNFDCCWCCSAFGIGSFWYVVWLKRSVKHEKVNVLLVIGTAILAVALAGCTGDSTPTSTSTATSKSTYSSSSSSKSSTSTKSDYHSGKGSEWDKQVNDIADEYGDDMGLSAEEIDAMMRAMEKGQG